LLLTFMGEALRDALDNRIADDEPEEEDDRIHLSRESERAQASDAHSAPSTRDKLLEVS
jgi:hypothetical protein